MVQHHQFLFDAVTVPQEVSVPSWLQRPSDERVAHGSVTSPARTPASKPSSAPISNMFHFPLPESSSRTARKSRKRADSTATNGNASLNSLEPAIDRPPSPERIRAYTEQMKRSSIFGGSSWSNTLSSSTASSTRSRGSTNTSMENPSLSRQSSAASRGSTIPPARERPESIQIFGRQLFPRRRRGNTHEHAPNRSASSLAVGEEIREGRDEYRPSTVNGSPQALDHDEPRARHFISTPFNFQHITHTRHNHLPNLQRTGQNELLSEFSAIRASQAPLHGDLKEIQTQDLHFPSFAPEAPTAPPQPVKYSQSHENLRSSPRSIPPPRPPRSPLSPTCPVALPMRTSSRTASVLLDDFDTQATATVTTDRPLTGAYRKTARHATPTPPLPPPATSWSEPQDSYFSDRPGSHAVTTPGGEAWPLASSPPGFGTELPDVQEEDEDAVAKRRSMGSVRSSVLRFSHSVPALRRDSRGRESAVTPPSTAAPERAPLSPGFQPSQESWDNAIDYAYDHEAEAHCDYQWDRCSFDDGATIDAGLPPFTEESAVDPHSDNEGDPTYHGRFRPSLLVPSAYDAPELSPLSNASTDSPDPRTPSNFQPTGRHRPASLASSFRESHGFNLSPSLLIPQDFQSQMDQDTLYEEAFKDTTTTPMFVPYPVCAPIDESASSAASFQSSDFSRGSARSSSSTRISTANSRGSQDSSMLGHPAGASQMHRSISSASSLPDLIPSMLRDLKQPADAEVPDVGTLSLKADSDPVGLATPTLDADDAAGGLSIPQHGRGKREHVQSHSVPHFNDNPLGLSPVAESFDNVARDEINLHSRKVSAPVVGASAKNFTVRARAATSTAAGVASRAGPKKRGSYMLFPQV